MGVRRPGKRPARSREPFRAVRVQMEMQCTAAICLCALHPYVSVAVTPAVARWSLEGSLASWRHHTAPLLAVSEDSGDEGSVYVRG